jgi:hypothetical protein
MRIALALALVALALVVPATSHASSECMGFANCSTQSQYWVWINAATRNGWTGSLEPGTASWQLSCPSGQVAIGYDFVYSTRGYGNQLTMAVTHNTGPTSSASFEATNDEFDFNVEVEPRLGCVPFAEYPPGSGTQLPFRNARAAARPARIRTRWVTHETRLKPGRTKSYFFRCPRGLRLIGHKRGVAFKTARPVPSAQTRGLHVQSREIGGAVEVRVATPKRVGDDEQAILQTRLACL